MSLIQSLSPRTQTLTTPKPPSALTKGSEGSNYLYLPLLSDFGTSFLQTHLLGVDASISPYFLYFWSRAALIAHIDTLIMQSFQPVARSISCRQLPRCLSRRAQRCFHGSANLQSGHSRWSTIKHDKGKNDALKNKQRSVFAQEIATCSKRESLVRHLFLPNSHIILASATTSIPAIQPSIVLRKASY